MVRRYWWIVAGVCIFLVCAGCVYYSLSGKDIHKDDNQQADVTQTSGDVTVEFDEMFKLTEYKQTIPVVQYKTFDIVDDTTQARLERLLSDNYSGIDYQIHLNAPIGEEGFVAPSKDDPYNYLRGSTGGLSLTKAAIDNAEADPDFNRKSFKKAVSSFFAEFSIEGADIEDMSIQEEKEYTGYYDMDAVREKSYRTIIRQKYDGISIANVKFRDSAGRIVRTPGIELQYGEKGWLTIDFSCFMSFGDIIQYINPVFEKKEILSGLESYFKVKKESETQSFQIYSIKLIYYPTDEGLLVPVWKIKGKYSIGQYGKIKNMYMNIENGQIYN